jgi:hypothetical protein
MAESEALRLERRWLRPVGAIAFAAVVLLVVSIAIAAGLSSGGGEAASLTKLHEHHSDVMVSVGLRSVAFLLLIAPLVLLFRAAAARSEKLRRQYLGLVIAAPIFLAAGSLLSAMAANEAASDFTSGKVAPQLTVKEASRECLAERREDQSSFKDEFGAGSAAVGNCVAEKREDDAAEQAITDASLRDVSGALQLAGGLAFVFAMAYSSLYAMRVGLLTRLWGSLGIGLGVAFLLPQFGLLTFLWFVYFGLLCCGWVPGGRPPAWAAGKAIPWPTPGEAAARELEGPEAPGAEEAQSIPEPDIPQEDEAAEPGQSGAPDDAGASRPKKRKRRDSGED